MAGLRYYFYEPSFAASTTFLVLFVLSTIHHAFMLVKRRTWYFIPFLIGVIFQAVGYVFRDISIKEKPDYTLPPFVIQAVLILVAPALYAASIYMILGRIIRLVNAEHLSIIRSTWVTKIFVAGDVLSFAVQGLGGSLISTADTVDELNRAKRLILVGLAAQLIFFGLFLVVTAVFHFRINRKPTPRSLEVLVPWRRFILVLYAASGIVLVRSIFRVAEYQQGRDGELQSKEVYFYVFDSTLMFIVALIFNIFHPSQIISQGKAEAFDLGETGPGDRTRVL